METNNYYVLISGVSTTQHGPFSDMDEAVEWGELHAGGIDTFEVVKLLPAELVDRLLDLARGSLHEFDSRSDTLDKVEALIEALADAELV